jgi:hypothetical protein
MTWSPLACGIVSGKYDSGIPPYSRASLKVSWGQSGAGHFAQVRLLGTWPWCWTELPWASAIPATVHQDRTHGMRTQMEPLTT